MEQDFSLSTSFRMHVSLYGQGSRFILAFHGFGQEGSIFEVFEKVIGSTHQLHSFDLPYHGKSQIPVITDGIGREELKNFFYDYFNSQNINNFILIGYSIGAKFALNLVDLFPERVKRLILIAPDGLTINFWYRVATGTGLSRKVFRYFMRHPGIFLKFTDLLSFFKVIHPSVSRFVKSQVSDEDIRNLIYNSWVNYRTLNLNIGHLGKLIVKHKIPVEIFLGEKDRLINSEDIRPLVREFPDTKVYMLPVGHHRLIEDAAEYYRSNGF
jgi:pimeloyl-ACP methyl ester carboxylesterase